MAIIGGRRNGVRVNGVEHRSNDAIATELSHGFLNNVERSLTRTYDEQCGLSESTQELRIGQKTDWRRIEQNPVVPRREILQKGFHPRRGQTRKRISFGSPGKHD